MVAYFWDMLKTRANIVTKYPKSAPNFHDKKCTQIIANLGVFHFSDFSDNDTTVFLGKFALRKCMYQNY